MLYHVHDPYHFFLICLGRLDTEMSGEPFQLIYQNSLADVEPFSDYMAKETEQGKILGKQIYRNRQGVLLLAGLFFSSALWGATSNWRVGLIVALLFFVIAEGVLLIEAGRKPIYFYSKHFYIQNEKKMTPREQELYLLPKALTMNEEYLQIENPEASHHYRWRCVDRIGITDDFVFFHVGTCPISYVPKRAFATEDGFKGFVEAVKGYFEKSRQ